MEKKFEAFAIVNLFGHQQLAGKVMEQSVGSATFIRVDIPDTAQQPKFTRFINPSAIYDIVPVTEEVSTARAQSLNVVPVHEWDIQEVVNKYKAALQENNS